MKFIYKNLLILIFLKNIRVKKFKNFNFDIRYKNRFKYNIIILLNLLLLLYF